MSGFRASKMIAFQIFMLVLALWGSAALAGPNYPPKRIWYVPKNPFNVATVPSASGSPIPILDSFNSMFLAPGSTELPSQTSPSLPLVQLTGYSLSSWQNAQATLFSLPSEGTLIFELNGTALKIGQQPRDATGAVPSDGKYCANVKPFTSSQLVPALQTLVGHYNVCLEAVFDFMAAHSINVGLQPDSAFIELCPSPASSFCSTPNQPYCVTSINDVNQEIANFKKSIDNTASNVANYMPTNKLFISFNEGLTHAYYESLSNTATVNGSKVTFQGFCSLAQLATFQASIKHEYLSAFGSIYNKTHSTSPFQVVAGDEEVPSIFSVSPNFQTDLTTYLQDFYSADSSINGTLTPTGPFGMAFFQYDLGLNFNWIPITKQLNTFLKGTILSPASSYPYAPTMYVGMLFGGGNVLRNNVSGESGVPSTYDPQTSAYSAASAQANAQMYYQSGGTAPDDVVIQDYFVNDPDLPETSPNTITNFINWFNSSYANAYAPSPIYQMYSPASQRSLFTNSAQNAINLATPSGGGLVQRYPLGSIFKQQTAANGLLPLMSYKNASGASYLTTLPSTDPSFPIQFQGSPSAVLGYVFPSNSSCNTQGPYQSAIAALPSSCTSSFAVSNFYPTPPSNPSVCSNAGNLPVYQLHSSTAPYSVAQPEYFYTVDPIEVCNLLTSSTAAWTFDEIPFQVVPFTQYHPNANNSDVPMISQDGFHMYTPSPSTTTNYSVINYLGAGTLVFDSQGNLTFNPLSGSSQTYFGPAPGNSGGTACQASDANMVFCRTDFGAGGIISTTPPGAITSNSSVGGYGSIGSTPSPLTAYAPVVTISPVSPYLVIYSSTNQPLSPQ